jgi:DNA-binding Xre family transcriptional regulator
MSHLGMAFDYVFNDLGIEANSFGELFRRSETAHLWAKGNPSVLAGKSGTELIDDVLIETGLGTPSREALFKAERTPAYWTGWSLAYFQWLTSLSFDRILDRISLDDWMGKYHPYHEMELSKLIDDLLILFSTGDTHLQTIRKQRGFTQKELAEQSSIHLRNIQMYEQRQNDINKAQSQILASLARTLRCSMEDLLELPLITADKEDF